MRHALAGTTTLLSAVLGCAQDGGHMNAQQKRVVETVSSDEPPIRITLNPEMRVSAALNGALPSPMPCGTAMAVAVKVINQGFVTGKLEAELVGHVSGVALDFKSQHLTGAPEESRKLYITLTKPEPIDLTIAFRLHHELPDLGGRDRIHFLIRCL